MAVERQSAFLDPRRGSLTDASVVPQLFMTFVTRPFDLRWMDHMFALAECFDQTVVILVTKVSSGTANAVFGRATVGSLLKSGVDR
jgi:hypothetical protein